MFQLWPFLDVLWEQCYGPWGARSWLVWSQDSTRACQESGGRSWPGWKVSVQHKEKCCTLLGLGEKFKKGRKCRREIGVVVVGHILFVMPLRDVFCEGIAMSRTSVSSEFSVVEVGLYLSWQTGDELRAFLCVARYILFMLPLLLVLILYYPCGLGSYPQKIG